MSFCVYTISLIQREPNPKSVALKQICSIAPPIESESPIIQLFSYSLRTNISIGASFIIFAVALTLLLALYICLSKLIFSLFFFSNIMSAILFFIVSVTITNFQGCLFLADGANLAQSIKSSIISLDILLFLYLRILLLFFIVSFNSILTS